MKIELIDTHAHLYLEAFNNDIDEVIERAIKKGVVKMFLPNIDSSTIKNMMQICQQYKGKCFPMMGLHPTSVKGNYEEELVEIEHNINNEALIAIGEIGIDLYWDKTFLTEQQIVFRQQLKWAKEMNLPAVIHARDSFNEIFEIMDEENDVGLTGVFHSFTGNEEQLMKILSYDFLIGINGIVTFKNSGLADIIKHIPPEKLLIETDAPFLAPTPYRGKRNESAYVIEVAEKLADILKIEVSDLAAMTRENAMKLFKRANSI